MNVMRSSPLTATRRLWLRRWTFYKSTPSRLHQVMCSSTRQNPGGLALYWWKLWLQIMHLLFRDVIKSVFNLNNLVSQSRKRVASDTDNLYRYSCWDYWDNGTSFCIICVCSAYASEHNDCLADYEWNMNERNGNNWSYSFKCFTVSDPPIWLQYTCSPWW